MRQHKDASVVGFLGYSIVKTQITKQAGSLRPFTASISIVLCGSNKVSSEDGNKTRISFVVIASSLMSDDKVFLK